ncbi:hypothetical protein CPLU01_13443 [Colletotrichum plurivorum]|uniref:Uncharacterized protein n=1 Tax=Colletotrichum plurivorum TaxID=2175906 RepID=A0A8H6JRU7_9PEZI|nr:hypothetical protein CPLU01_13443 [Colletotrichum plurivorum]
MVSNPQPPSSPNLILKQNIPSLLTLLAIPSALALGSWTCTSNGPGPGLPGLHSAQAVFTALYGDAPLTLEAEEARVATCDGLLFGLWNGHPYRVTEQPGLRSTVAMQDPGEDGTECLSHADDEEDLDDDLRLSYMFGVGEDSWVSGGLTEIRRC